MGMLGDKRFIRTLRLQNFLSFGPASPEIELKSLNVLIGPNGAGKSNFIEAIDFLAASATDLTRPIRSGGGVQEWIWKGLPDTVTAEIDATLYYPENSVPLRHRLSFSAVNSRFELIDEAVENEYAFPDKPDVYFYYRYQQGHPVLNVQLPDTNGTSATYPSGVRNLRREDLELDQSVIKQRRDPELYPEITYLGNNYPRIKLYREWNLGRNTPARKPQAVDAPNDFLREDASNLGLVLNMLERNRAVHNQIEEHLRDFYASFDSISILFEGGTIQVFLNETGFNHPIPATRLSDGTLRYLCLLAVLCHPKPPPLICIEEPELGLHPDIMPNIADLLIDASHRTQLIVTTHSDILIDALSEIPEAVIVCEKENGSTNMQRLSQHNLKEWLKDYSLGKLWRDGELGGNRW
ncbi:MAG: AAA family ATPase [Caldilineaceae bacterium]